MRPKPISSLHTNLFFFKDYSGIIEQRLRTWCSQNTVTGGQKGTQTTEYSRPIEGGITFVVFGSSYNNLDSCITAIKFSDLNCFLPLKVAFIHVDIPLLNFILLSYPRAFQQD